MDKETSNLKDQMRKSLDELETVRDEIRVNLHLAAMDAKDKWNQLEPHIEEARTFAREASQSAKAKVEELLRRARVVRDAIRDSKAH